MIVYNDYYRQLKLQVEILKELLDNPRLDDFDWKYSVHKEVCKLDDIINEYYHGDSDGIMGY